MGWVSDAITALGRGEEVVIRPRGGSMRGRIEDGAAVKLAPCSAGALRAEDIVLVRVGGSVFLHRIVRREGERLLIGNNVGGINGWAGPQDVYGLAVEVNGRPVRGRVPGMEALIDIGVNLSHRSFDADREQVVARALAAGVATMVVTGTSLPASRSAAHLARGRPGVLYATAGVHPHHAKDCDASTVQALRTLATRPEVVAVGECGLDFYRNLSPREVQERQLEAQLELAAEVGKPVFLHEREASVRFGEILARHRPHLVRGVVHCFTGSEAELLRWLELDLHIGITGWICDERRGRHLLPLVRRIPLDRLMLETDAPFLFPRNRAKGRDDGRNEPAFLPSVLEVVARALDRSPAEVAQQTTRTARRFFGLGDRAGSAGDPGGAEGPPAEHTPGGA